MGCFVNVESQDLNEYFSNIWSSPRLSYTLFHTRYRENVKRKDHKDVQSQQPVQPRPVPGPRGRIGEHVQGDVAEQGQEAHAHVGVGGQGQNFTSAVVHCTSEWD